MVIGGNKYKNNGIKLYETMQEELLNLVGQCDDVLFYIEHLANDVEELEKEKVFKYDYENFYLFVESFKVQVSLLESFRKALKNDCKVLKELGEKGKQKEVTVKDAEKLYNQTQYMINGVASLYECLKPLKDEVYLLNRKARSVIERPHDNYKIIYDIMGSIYRRSVEARRQIDKLGTFFTNVQEGKMQEILLAEESLKKDIELLRIVEKKR